MTDNKSAILIIDDSVAIIKTLSELLKADYTVFFSTEGKKGIELAKKKKPDLIILDVKMEPIDGYEVCRQLKASKTTSDIPILFVTSSVGTMDEARGFELGATDYITKPFIPVVILARIHHHIQSYLNYKELKRLYSLALDANPITRWPGNNTIRKHIDELIRNKEDQCILYCDLDNFKSYNDKYGFAKGDKVILDTARLIQKTASDMGITDAFFGHIGGDDFMLTIPVRYADTYANTLVNSFDKMITRHYNDEDLKLGYIISKNRFNDVIRFPLIALSIASVCLSERKYANYLEVSDHCSEIKRQVKKIEGSAYMRDRRLHA